MIHYILYREDGEIHSMSSHEDMGLRVYLPQGALKMDELVIPSKDIWDGFLANPKDYLAQKIPGGVTLVPRPTPIKSVE